MRKELSLCCQLHGLADSDNDFTVDVVSRATAGEIVQGHGKSLEHRTVGLCFAQTLDQLVADVSGVQVGEDQHVGLSGNRAAGSLGFADAGNDGGISLEFTVAEDIQLAFFDATGEFSGGFADLDEQIIFGAAFGEKERNATLGVLPRSER
jgi:hypothetical protein